MPKKVSVLPTPPEAPEQNLAVSKIDPIRFEGLPAFQSLDWELQYPPGGSTHPSYPYPNLDPRLIFQQPFVPVVDGLPDASRVPKLALPMGWRHVSWCGLLPIAFDPYRQAFKLTPIGPMPLTCEEVHQMGLHKYVPGGELHPESGLLPQMMTLSDGSDGEVYNWEGVDWVLPWAENGSLDTASFLSPLGPPGVDNAIVSLSPPIADAWDCPDNIVDLEDAIRWLGENEQRAKEKFEPTIGKTWRGTKIRLTARKIKQPIASLIAFTLADKSNYLMNQNRRDFCPFKSMATPVHVDIKLLKDIEITLFEFLCYFPSHFRWRKGADRLVRSGLSASDITNLINMVRCLDGDSALSRANIFDPLWNEYESSGNRKKVRIVRDEHETTTNYTTEDWTYTASDVTDYPILGLAHGLKDLPVGPDAGPLTALIRWCRENERYTAMLGDVPELLQEANIQQLIEPGEAGCPDKEVHGRYVEALKKDRLRVLKSSKEMKRAAEGGVEGSQKRKKTE